ncbi:hypothetical protein EON65_16555 [archaeon]|nr:MAG: hypothetical protein EON65_16555 [archaeon]
MIGWFSAGTDQKADKPDLFGCVQLPSINCCFGVSDTAYGDIQRKQLLELLSDEKQQIMPWTKTLKNSFNLTAVSVDEVLCGSPMLDVALGQVDAVKKVLKHLIRQDDIKSGKKKGVSRFSRKDESMQLDNVLPPEMPTSWVQCEGCKKWRRVPWHVDADSLSEEWQCNMNSWDVENATCEAPQDSFDPATENTVQYSGDIEIQEVKIEDFKIGEWRDVFCLRNKVYYEGQVKRIKPPTKKKKNQLLFHYRGWSSSFDEWVEFDSDRIAPHHLYTNPDTTDPREQEVWQGREPVQSVIRSAVGLNAAANPSGTKRRKSEESASANKSPRIEGDVEREEAAIVG